MSDEQLVKMPGINVACDIPGYGEKGITVEQALEQGLIDEYKLYLCNLGSSPTVTIFMKSYNSNDLFLIQSDAGSSVMLMECADRNKFIGLAPPETTITIKQGSYEPVDYQP